MALISKMLPFALIAVASGEQHLRRGDLAAVASGRKLADATEALAVAALDEEEAELKLEKAQFNEAAVKNELFEAELYEAVAEHKLEEAVVNELPEIDFNGDEVIIFDDGDEVIIFDDEDIADSYVPYETPKKTSKCKQETTTTKAPTTTTTTTTIAATEADEYEFGSETKLVYDSEKGEWVEEKAEEWDSRTVAVR